MIILPFAIGMNLIEYVDLNTYEKMSIFKGKHTDFGPKWYSDIGNQIVIMLTILSF